MTMAKQAAVGRQRPHQSRQKCKRKRRPSLTAFITLLTLIASASGSSSYEPADLFSSSIVTHHEDDVSLKASQSQRRRGPQHHDCTNRYPTDRYGGLRIHRTFIDRDPIYYEEEIGQGRGLSLDDGIFDDYDFYQSGGGDPLSSFHDRLHDNEWQSPLERLAPLPSLSLAPSTAAIASSPPVTINPGPRHSHEVDIFQQQQQQQQPLKLKTRSTGTTIAALLANNSTVLILAADTRATDGSTVADKRCEKLHALARNVWCAGAGTSADVEAMVRKVKFSFWKRGVLTREGGGGCGGGGVGNMNFETANSDATILLNEEDRDVPSASVPAVLHYIRSKLQKTRGNLGVNLLAGGYDHASHRAHLAAIHPHGSMDVVTYAALGSGGLAATGVLESKYPRMGNGECTVEEGMRLAVDAVRAGIDNDLGSGSQVDVCVIGREGVLYRRAVVREEELTWVSVNENEVDGKDSADIPKLASEQDLDKSAGVNGFGNVPFAIQSKRLVSGGKLNVADERKRWLDEVLGNN